MVLSTLILFHSLSLYPYQTLEGGFKKWAALLVAYINKGIPIDIIDEITKPQSIWQTHGLQFSYGDMEQV